MPVAEWHDDAMTSHFKGYITDNDVFRNPAYEVSGSRYDQMGILPYFVFSSDQQIELDF